MLLCLLSSSHDGDCVLVLKLPITSRDHVHCVLGAGGGWFDGQPKGFCDGHGVEDRCGANDRVVIFPS